MTTGSHYLCVRSDLYVCDVTVANAHEPPPCPEHGRKPYGKRATCLERCAGPDADAKAANPPCLACVRGTAYALRYSKRIRSAPRSQRRRSR